MVRVHAALFRVAPTRDNKIRKGEMIMAKKHAFARGLATGVVGTAATVAGAVFAVKKTIIEPEEMTFLHISAKSRQRDSGN